MRAFAPSWSVASAVHSRNTADHHGDYAAIDVAARRVERGVLAVGNFALTVVLMQKFAEMAAKWIPQWEIIDYAHGDKVDAPSGTARELATRLARVRLPETTVPVEQTEIGRASCRERVEVSVV